MSKLPFVCLNVEPESDVDDDIDNTAELQVEEALKLYQNALKLHSQGYRTYDAAREAYDELFRSEIFSYPEALSLSRRLEIEDAENSSDSSNEDGGDSSDESENAAPPARLATNGLPSTLPQVLYLSYKNYAQFQLDSLHYDLLNLGMNGRCIDDFDPDLKKDVLDRASKCLGTLCDAVDKDDTDPEVWRQMSRLSALLGSPRLTRYCLEAVLRIGIEDETELSDSLEYALAREDLAEIRENLQEDLDDDMPALDGSQIPAHLREALDPCPGLPTPSREQSAGSLSERAPTIIELRDFDWFTLGSAIMKHCYADEKPWRGFDKMGTGYRIQRSVEPVPKSDSKPGRRRKTTEILEARRMSSARSNTDDVDMPAPDAPLSPTQTRGVDDLASPSSERQLPMRTFSTESMKPESAANALKEENDGKVERAVSLKRSPDAAGMPQDPPEARSRSKRLRARETGPDEEALSRDLKQQIEKQMKPLNDADRHLFDVCQTLLGRMGINIFGTFESLRDVPIESSAILDSDPDGLSHAMSDFRKILKTWNANRSSLLNQGTGAGATATLISKGNEAGLASFMEHAKTGQKKGHEQMILLNSEGLDGFLATVNSQWLDINNLALSWLRALLDPAFLSADQAKSKYLDYKWGPQLKEALHGILTHQDAHVFASLAGAISSQDFGVAVAADSDKIEILTVVELIQTVFEIHLDVFNSMIKPTSKVDQPTRTLQKARLQRWTMLASQAIARLNALKDEEDLDTVSLRHLFSMILYMSLDESNDREHIIYGLHEVKDILRREKTDLISLPNIDIMPEISIDAVEQEISRLTTTDFFMSVFSPSDDDPVITIESLEPILMPTRDEMAEEQRDGPSAQLLREEIPSPPTQTSQKVQLQEFLEKSTASLRLSLWSRLLTAYTAIEYAPMVFVCTIRSMELVLSEVETETYLAQPEETRLANLIVWLRNLVDLTDRCVSLITTETSALDGMDESNLRLALTVIAQCTKIFHLFALWDDGVRLSQTSAPPQQPGSANAYKQAMALLRDMQIKTWRLLYALLRDASRQNRELFPDADDDFLAFLAAVHSAVGLREYCRLNKKSFLKFLKPEILALEPADLNEWRYQMAQLAYDLYDLRVLADSNTWMTLQEHNCPADQLDRATAREILPMVMAQIHAMKLKDITKPDRREFKQAIDEIQELIGIPKANSSNQLFNRRQLNHFQKTPLRTEDLEGCLRGEGGFINMPVRNDYTAIAKTGWFFVVGYLRLASFRSVRRQGPDSTKELDEAASFLRVDIDYDCEKWETWYRLAQVYDSMLDEEVAWTTDRINNKMDDLIGLQRQAIHCYQRAIALSVSNAGDLSGPHGAQPDELAGIVSEMYSDFGMRLYAASRPPFNMQAFSVKDHGRWYYTPMGRKFKAQPFIPTRDAQVWLFASVLFRQALIDRPNDWLNWYMLGKCLWKLLHHPDAGGVTKENVLEAFAKACETAPAKDPRRDGSPTLEPHQKLVSVVHKLVHARGLRNFMNPADEPHFMDREQGYDYLLRSPYSKKVEFKEPRGSAEWLAFVRGMIKNLRAADKTNWHHRIVSRAADLAFHDESEEDPAKAALGQLDTIITKNMALTVWRPAFERVGRHFVYTTRYIKRIIELLQDTGERGKLELLGKRVRKKQAEFIDHQRIWSKICKTYITLLRAQAQVPDLHEENVLSVLPFEKFVYNAALLQAWAQPTTGDPPEHPLLPVLRELFDLKKLNLNLIPNQGIDDLIGDTYAKIYQSMVPGLVNTAANEKNREAMRVDRILMGDPDLEEKAEASGTEAVALTNPSGRAKIVGRMEVRRRAEALVQRLSPVQASSAAPDEPTTENAAAETADEGDGEGPEAQNSFDANNDADDESELSELEDEEVNGDVVNEGEEGNEDEEEEGQHQEGINGEGTHHEEVEEEEEGEEEAGDEEEEGNGDHEDEETDHGEDDGAEGEVGADNADQDGNGEDSVYHSEVPASGA